MDLVVQVRMAEEKSADRCAYLFCQNDACARPTFDFSCLGIRGLDNTSRLCAEHVDLIRRRVHKVLVQDGVRAPLLYSDWSRSPSQELAQAPGDLERFTSGLSVDHPVRQAHRRLMFFKRKLFDSPARRDTEALGLALDEVMRALGPRGRRGQIAAAWIGLQLALQESRRRRWNARRTAEWVEVVAFYGGLCAYCEEAAWGHVDHVVPLSRGGADSIGNAVPACQSCNLRKCDTLGWMPRRKHRLLTTQESPTSRESYADVVSAVAS